MPGRITRWKGSYKFRRDADCLTHRPVEQSVIAYHVLVVAERTGLKNTLWRSGPSPCPARCNITSDFPGRTQAILAELLPASRPGVSLCQPNPNPLARTVTGAGFRTPVLAFHRRRRRPRNACSLLSRRTVTPDECLACKKQLNILLSHNHTIIRILTVQTGEAPNTERPWAC